MKAEHGKVSAKQLDNWWRMKQRGEGRSGGGSGASAGSGSSITDRPDVQQFFRGHLPTPEGS